MSPGTHPPGAAAAITAAVGCKGKRPATAARRSQASASSYAGSSSSPHEQRSSTNTPWDNTCAPRPMSTMDSRGSH
eukprot:238776-Prymnesium_polylepis.1